MRVKQARCLPLAILAAATLVPACAPTQDGMEESPTSFGTAPLPTDESSESGAPSDTGETGAPPPGGSSSGASMTTATSEPGDSGSSGGDSTSGDTGPDPATVLFEEDFEGAAEDTVPDDWDSFVAYVVNMNNNPGGMAFALADSSRAHGGSKALHVLGGQTPAMLTRPFPPGVDRIYVRVYVWLTAKLGQNPANNHETLIGVRASVGQANDEVRFGEIKGVIGTNEVPSDDISPTMDAWGSGPVIEAGTWNCVEVAFLADQPNHEVRAWNNGDEVHVVNDPSQWNNGVLGDQFLTGKFNEFIIGWHSFSNYGNEIWFDDLVVATKRVGCR